VTESRKRSAAETWRALEEMTEEAEDEAKIDAEMERILSLSEDEVSRELADAGFDPADVRARGEAIGREAAAHEAAAQEAAAQEAAHEAAAHEVPDALPAPIAPPRVHPIAPRRAAGVRTVLLIAAALGLAAALLMAALVVLHSRPDNVASPRPTPESTPQPQEK
jgi:hypothetical protein